MKKTKQKTKATKSSKVKKAKPRTYEAYLLGLALISLLSGEFALITTSTAADWKVGVAVLDMSDAMPQLVADVKFAAEPAAFTISSINEFYNEAAVATTEVLDLSSTDADPLMLVYGITDFYEMASREMASVLDLSEYVTTFSPQVAGTSTSTSE